MCYMLQVFVFVLFHGCFIAGVGGGEQVCGLACILTWPFDLAPWFAMDGKNAVGWQYINDQQPKYKPLLLCMSYAKDLGCKTDEGIQHSGV